MRGSRKTIHRRDAEKTTPYTQNPVKSLKDSTGNHRFHEYRGIWYTPRLHCTILTLRGDGLNHICGRAGLRVPPGGSVLVFAGQFSNN
jgi:hypothetical protein